MPMVNVKITREGATAEQKSRVIAEMTEVLARVLGKNPATTIVIIEEVETENWGIAGASVSERRKRELEQSRHARWNRHSLVIPKPSKETFKCLKPTQPRLLDFGWC